MPKSIFILILSLVAVLSFAKDARAKGSFEVIEISQTHLMIVPKTWALEEEKGAKITIISYCEIFKDALVTLSARYNIKAIVPIEGFAVKEELIKTGGTLTAGLILEVEKK